MKIKKLLAVVSLISMLGITAPVVINNAQSVQASTISLKNGHYYEATQRDLYVKLKKPMTIYRFHLKFPTAYSTMTPYKRFRKGKKLHIMEAQDPTWLVWGKGLPGSYKKRDKFTVRRGPADYSWFKVIKVCK